jgi:ubiquinone/menaquinone biosynthesis C-methylase UbiE
MLAKLGSTYAKKLTARGFAKGTILDAGCGFGGMDLVVAHEIPECEIIGIDLSDPLLAYAQSSVSDTKLEHRLRFQKGDVHTIPFDDNSFDVVFNVNMVHLVNKPVIMLNELERVLKPNGYLFIKDLRRSWLSLFEREITSALTLNEAKHLIAHSQLRNGTFSQSILWWNFEVW